MKVQKDSHYNVWPRTVRPAQKFSNFLVFVLCAWNEVFWSVQCPDCSLKTTEVPNSPTSTVRCLLNPDLKKIMISTGRIEEEVRGKVAYGALIKQRSVWENFNKWDSRFWYPYWPWSRANLKILIHLPSVCRFLGLYNGYLSTTFCENDFRVPDLNVACTDRCEIISVECISNCPNDDSVCWSQCFRKNTVCINGK